MKISYPALILAFSANVLGLYVISNPSLVGVIGLLASVDSIAPSKDKLFIDPGVRVPLLYMEGDMVM